MTLSGRLLPASVLLALWAGCSEEVPPAPKPKSNPFAETSKAPAKPSSVPTPVPVVRTPAEKMRDLRELRKARPTDFRRQQEGWSALLGEARSDADRTAIRDELESLDSEANKAYRDLVRPLRARIREALDAGVPSAALATLEGWSVPAEFDFQGLKSKEREEEIALLRQYVRIDALRKDLVARYRGGDLSRNDKAEFRPYLTSPQLRLRVEAEKALAETHRLRTLQTARRRLAGLRERPEEERRGFGDFRSGPGPTERRLASTRPPELYLHLGDARKKLDDMMAATTFEEFAVGLKEGLAALDRGIEKFAFFPVTWYLRAEWKYGLQGDVLGALSDLDQAVDRQRNYVEARMARALLLLEVPMSAQAEKELKVLSRALPEPSRAAADRALDLAKEKQYAEAGKTLAAALRQMPDDLAFLEARAKRPEQPAWTGDVQAKSAHYLVRVDLGKNNRPAANALARAQEFSSVLETAREYFAGLIPLPTKSKGVANVWVFADEEAYHDYADVDPLQQLNESAGMFLPDRRQLLVLASIDADMTREVLIHEALHEYVDATGFRIPTWLNEGLADYAGGIRIVNGTVAERGLVLPHPLESLRGAMEDGWKGVPFDVMLREDQKEFYGVLRSLQYEQAWSMVHFFKHGRSLRYEPLFSAYLKALAGGKAPGPAAAAAFGGTDLEVLQAEWLEYVKSLK